MKPLLPPRTAVLAPWIALSLGLCSIGCSTQQQLAAQLETATQQQHLPEVVACWEKEFEAAGFRGEYEVVVDFTVELGSGRIQDVVVRGVDPTGDDTEPLDPLGADRLSRCIRDALAASNLSRGGFTPSTNVHVRDFRLLLADASSQARKAAASQTPNILLGPRADRCLGLYTHDPPRDAATLVAELAEAEQAAEKSGPGRDERARALQRVYDLALELGDRLNLDLGADQLSAASRKKMFEQIRRAEGIANRTGRAIGCKPPIRDVEF